MNRRIVPTMVYAFNHYFPEQLVSISRLKGTDDMPIWPYATDLITHAVMHCGVGRM
jgi:hypothetical protein